MEWVANNIQYLRQECYKPNESYKSCESNFQHLCPNNPILTCNCSDSKFCAELPNDNGWLKCPDSGKLCSTINCPDGCKGDNSIQDGFSDNTGYITEHVIEHEAQPKHSQRESISWWSGPCVVIGDIREARNSSAEPISSDEHESGNT
jgi:hypothetical protein